MTTSDRFSPSSAPLKRVKRIQFSVFNPDELVSVHSPCGGACLDDHLPLLMAPSLRKNETIFYGVKDVSKNSMASFFFMS